MLKQINICLWQHRPSIHQVALVKALKVKSNLTWLLEFRNTYPERVDMGWHMGEMNPDFVLSEIELEELLNRLPEDCVHIFGGTRSSKKMRTAYKRLLSEKARVFVQTETPNHYRLWDKIKIFRGIIENVYEYKKLEGIFAIGSLGVNYFKLIGYEKKKIFPFGYFTQTTSNKTVNLKSNSYNIIYVGQLIKRKGVDILIKSLNGLDAKYYLNIFGNGNSESDLKKLCMELNLGSKIKFNGSMSNIDVMGYIKASDILVLPSRWDGWGAVVSEALSNGTPVLVTDKCGSSILLRENYQGEVVKSGSVMSLRNAISNRIKHGKTTPDQRKRISQWADCISGDSAAQYLINCISGFNPKPPWF